MPLHGRANHRRVADNLIVDSSIEPLPGSCIFLKLLRTLI